jgi:hypothetical protein
MDRAIRQADRIVAVLSPTYEQATSFTVPEWTAAIGRDPTGEHGVLVPVRVTEFTPGGLWHTRGWIDLAGKDGKAATDALLAGIAQERMKPAREPAFPGAKPPEPAFPGTAEQQVWQIPVARNPAFTGRGRLLDRLHEALTDPRRRPARVVLSGLGGVGKTQLAVEYAHTHREDYRVVWWVRADRPATVRGDLASLAAALGAG